MEEKIRRSLREPVQAFPRDLAEKAGTRTKKRNEEGGGEGNIREIKSHVDGKRQIQLRISQNRKYLKQIKTVENNSNE